MTKVAIFGASGYGGAELARMVLGHPQFELVYLAGHSTAGKTFGEVYSHLPQIADMVIEAGDFETAASKADVLVFALHPGDGTAMVAQSVAAGKKTLDFSADFRLKNLADYERYYGAHPMPELIGKAVYGLPELHRADVAATNFVAVPGCYPTSGTLALAPAVAGGLVETKGLIVDSLSGVSGAGRKLALGSHFSEVNESLTAYKVASHRHTPEMNQELSFASCACRTAAEVKVTFTPHLIPISRGILSTAYGNLVKPMTAGEVWEVYQEYYDGEPCVRVLPLGAMPFTKAVAGTNRCDIGVAVDEDNGRLIVVAAIDNLIKGLSGAALQCMNLRCGFDETLGVPMMAMWP
ncbi:MAG: N-acetyl-gamma-glutamyl-phosphate reductase [Armatimonadia bacterium]